MPMDPTGVKTRIVPPKILSMDVRRVCVLIMAIPPGAMEREMSIMIPILTNMEKIHGVIGNGPTENAIPCLVTRVPSATVTGSVKKGFVYMKSATMEPTETPLINI